MGTFLVIAISAIGALSAISAGILALVVFQEDHGCHARPTPVRHRVHAPVGTMMLADVADRDALNWDEIDAANERAEQEWSGVLAAHAAWMRASAHREELAQLPVAA